MGNKMKRQPTDQEKIFANDVTQEEAFSGFQSERKEHSYKHNKVIKVKPYAMTGT